MSYAVQVPTGGEDERGADHKPSPPLWLDTRQEIPQFEVDVSIRGGDVVDGIT